MGTLSVWSESLLARASLIDRQCVIRAQQSRWSNALNWPLVLVSRLGDGFIWGAIMLLLPWLDSSRGVSRMAQLLVLGGINVALYLWLKPRIARPRPCAACDGVCARTPPMDTFSFPSGHTLHAVAFTVVLSHHYPVLSSLLWLFCLLVATSRVVLGLHYPSDVLFAAGLAFLTAHVALYLG